MKQYATYILASHSSNPTLYIGVTSKLITRHYQHKEKLIPGFTAKYNRDKLVYFDILDTATEAIAREKQLKNWRRQWKLDLIRENNPQFMDLAREFD